MMPLTLPSSNGGIVTYDADGDVILRSGNDQVEIYVSLVVDGQNTVGGETTLNDTLHVNADSDFNGNVAIGDKISFTAGTGALVMGALTLNGPLDADGQTIDGAVVTGATINGAEINGGVIDGATINASTLNSATISAIVVNTASLNTTNMNISGSSLDPVVGTGILVGNWEVTGTWTESSARKGKADLRKMPDARRLLEVPTWTYRKARDTGAARQVGLMAEDVAELGLEELVTRDENGDPIGVRYSRVAAVLLDIVREQDARIERLERAILEEREGPKQ